MKTVIATLIASTFTIGAWAETSESLIAEALKKNPELLFYTAEVEALPKSAKTEAPKIPIPLDFPSRDKLRAALLNLDEELARLYLAEFRFSLAAAVRLKAMEYQASAEAAATAAGLASRTGALIKMLEERPAAGVVATIERRILEGAALPFVQTAAKERVRNNILRSELNGLLGRQPDAELNVKDTLVIPSSAEVKTNAPLLMKIREAEIARGLAGLDAATEVESFIVGPWFTREGLGANEALSGTTRPGTTAGSSLGEKRSRLLDDARTKLDRELTIRRAALDAAREVALAMPETLIENLKSASDLAERQYRVGALGVNILIEAHREYLGALESRNEAITQAWRNALDLELLNLPASTKPDGKIIVSPKP